MSAEDSHELSDTWRDVIALYRATLSDDHEGLAAITGNTRCLVHLAVYAARLGIILAAVPGEIEVTDDGGAVFSEQLRAEVGELLDRQLAVMIAEDGER